MSKSYDVYGQKYSLLYTYSVALGMALPPYRRPSGHSSKPNLPAIIRPDPMGQHMPRLRSLVLPPPHYHVLLLNDDYTSAKFVAGQLRRHFNKSKLEAEELTFQVHQKGVALAGTYPFEIAEEKMTRMISAARNQGYPFLAKLEQA